MRSCIAQGRPKTRMLRRRSFHVGDDLHSDLVGRGGCVHFGSWKVNCNWPFWCCLSPRRVGSLPLRRMILVRRVAHRRLSLFQFVDGILTTAVSISLAAMGYTIWALLATNLSTLTLSIVMFYVWRRYGVHA
ncbi:MAG: oligosaccharide flippase family protein [Caldilineaceae bacterium]